MGLENFKLYFNNPSCMYRPGDTLDGHIQITVNSTKQIKKIFIEISGKASVYWTVNDSSDSSTSYTNEERFFKAQINVVDSSRSGEKVELRPGNHMFPFKYLLPRNLPSSFKGNHGKIKYKIKATLDCPWNIDKHIEAPLIVKALSDIQNHPKAREPGVLAMEKEFGILFTSNPLKTIVRVPHSGFAAGKIIPITFGINNKSKTAVNGLSVKLKQITTYHARNRDNKEEITLSKNAINFKIKPNTSTSISHSLQVPINVNLHDLSNCKIIDIDYELKVEILTAGMTRNLVGKMSLYPTL